MASDIDFWRLAAGLGLFLFGMHQLEQALQKLAGRPFKQFLRQYTQRPIKGVMTGALSTAALQSSSVVGLIVLAFVGTEVISLSSGVAIVALHDAMHTQIYKEVVANGGSETEISSLLNVNRELHTSNQSLLFAIADAVLEMQMADDFRALPATH